MNKSEVHRRVCGKTWDAYSSFNSRRYSTLLQRIKTSPKVPLELPSCISSVFASFRVSRSTYLKVHIVVRANKKSLVLQAPLETDDHFLSYLILQEWFGIERNILQVSVGAGKSYRHRKATVVSKATFCFARRATPLVFQHVAPRVIRSHVGIGYAANKHVSFGRLWVRPR